MREERLKKRKGRKNVLPSLVSFNLRIWAVSQASLGYAWV